jgi:hypothetical protein
MATAEMVEILRALRRLTAWLRLADEQTEARVRALNDLVRALPDVTSPPLTILGDFMAEIEPEVVYDRAHPPEVLQCALIAPFGIGVVTWDRKACDRAQTHPGGFEAAARENFAPYDALKLYLRRIVHAHLNGLWERAKQKLGDRP